MKRETQRILGLLSFTALIIFSVSTLLAKIGGNMGFFLWVGNGLLLFVVLMLAYHYVRKLSSAWKIVYFVIAVLAIISFIWGIGIF